MPSGGIQRLEGRQDPVRSRRERRIGEDRTSAGALDRLRDLRVAGRDGDGPDTGRLGLMQHPHDHRQAADVRQGLSRKPGRGHARWDDDDGVHVAI